MFTFIFNLIVLSLALLRIAVMFVLIIAVSIIRAIVVFYYTALGFVIICNDAAHKATKANDIKSLEYNPYSDSDFSEEELKTLDKAIAKVVAEQSNN